MPTPIIQFRLSEALQTRIAALPVDPRDRSDSDTYRRLLALACDTVEAKQRAAAAPASPAPTAR